MDRPQFARWVLQGFISFALLILTILLAVFIVNVRYRCKAEGLLRDVQTLRVGQSTRADVQRIMSRNGGSASQSYASFCAPMDGAYDVSIGSQTIARVEQSIPV